MELKQIINTSLQLFVEEVIEMDRRGWKMSEQDPPSLFGYAYTCSMEKTDLTRGQREKIYQDFINEKPVLDRVAMAAVARAGKGKGKATEKEEQE